MKILVIEDDADLAELIGGFLERHGWIVETTGTVRDARQALRQGEYQVVVADLRLPDGSSLDLFDPAPPAYPCVAILLTGATGAELCEESRSAGFHECLTKPLAGSDLVRAIVALTRAPPASRGAGTNVAGQQDDG